MNDSVYEKDSFCSYCGHSFEDGEFWPRTCKHCGNKTYRNPIPVSVVLLPVDGGLLTVRRDIEPAKGELALPGGFVEAGETWQEAGVRELCEETGVRIDATTLEAFRVFSAPDDTLIIFGLAPPYPEEKLPPFPSVAESSERVILKAPAEMAFSTHTRVVEDYFSKERQKDAP